MKTVSIDQLSQEFNIDEKIIHKELLNVIKQLETKKVRKHFIVDEPNKKVFVIKYGDLQFIKDGLGKLSFNSLAEHFKLDLRTANWLLEKLLEDRKIEKEVLDYYGEVKNKPSVRVWFEPDKVSVGEDATLNIEISSPTQISKPRLSVSDTKVAELEYEPKMPSKILKGKRLEKFKYKAMKHGQQKIDIELEGIIDGMKYGPEKVATAAVQIKPLPPEIYVVTRRKKIPANYKKEETITLTISNEGAGEARNMQIRGLENYQELNLLSGTKVGNIAPHGKIEYPLNVLPQKSGKYTFDNIILAYEDVEGKEFEIAIPSFVVNVETLKPELKTEIRAPSFANSGQIFSLTVKITNIGRGEARNLSFEIPIDPKLIMSGILDCSLHRLISRATQEFTITLEAPKEGEIKIKDFDINFQDVEGNPMTEKCYEAIVPVHKLVGPKPSAEWPFTIDSIIGEKYHILQEVGQGRFAKVYLGQDTLLRRKIALKALRDDFIYDQVVVDMFIEEAKTVIDLGEKGENPNILRVMDARKEKFAGKEYPYIVMEYMAQGTLEDAFLPGKPMNLIDSLNVMRDLCSALIYAHQQNVVHCDIKPSNVFYDKERDAWKLGDFGLAKIIQKSEMAYVGGTPTYMAPEVRKGEITKKSDVYSLGVVFKEILTGHPRGDLSLLERKYKKLDSSRLHKLTDLIEKMTNSNPSRRPRLKDVSKVVKWSVTWFD